MATKLYYLILWSLKLLWRRPRKARRRWKRVRLLMNVITDKSGEQFRHIPCPAKVCGVRVPQNLNDLSYGDLVEVQSILSLPIERALIAIVSRFTNCPEALVPRMDYRDVWGVFDMVCNEVERIGELFKECEVKPSSQELRANPPVGDWFSMVDWFAQRMGYRDHNEAIAVKWQYYYKCAKIDAEKNKYERRLMEVQSNDMKAKTKKH